MVIGVLSTGSDIQINEKRKDAKVRQILRGNRVYGFSDCGIQCIKLQSFPREITQII